MGMCHTSPFGQRELEYGHGNNIHNNDIQGFKSLDDIKKQQSGGNVARKFLHSERGEILCCMEQLMFGHGVQYCSHREHQ
jgi:hypothetical protein